MKRGNTHTKSAAGIVRKASLLFVLMLLMHSAVYAADSVPSASVIQFSLLNQDPDPVEPGNFVELRWLVTNGGYVDARDVTFEIVYNYPFSLPEGDNGQRKYAVVTANPDEDESIILYYKLYVDPDALEGTEKVKMRYKIGDSEWRYSSDEFEVRVRTYDSYLQLSSVDVSPSSVEPGQEAEVKLTFQNSADTALSDIKVGLDVASSSLPFSTLTSGNEKVIPNLDKEESVSVSFKIITDPEAELGLYKVPVKLSYRDTNGDNFSSTNYIGILVASTPEVYASLDESEITKAGTSGKVSVKFVNKGISDIKFLDVKLEQSDDYDLLSADEVYIGNIDSDDYETVDFKLFVKPTDKRFIDLPLTYSYRDANNKLFEEKQVLKLRLYSEEELKKYGFVKEKSFSGLLIVAVVLIAGYFVWRRFRKRK